MFEMSHTMTFIRYSRAILTSILGTALGARSPSKAPSASWSSTSQRCYPSFLETRLHEAFPVICLPAREVDGRLPCFLLGRVFLVGKESRAERKSRSAFGIVAVGI